MPELYIQNFSCIKEATLSVSPVNVIIGPQGSGKSVTTKLLYFFTDVFNSFFDYAEQNVTIDYYKKHLSKQFAIWFPPSAWGTDRLKLIYTAGDFDMRVLRRMSGGKLIDEVSIKFSDWFAEFYERTRNDFCKNITQIDDLIEETNSGTLLLDQSFRVRETARQKFSNRLKSDYIAQQTFIPAGRAFFTTIGRLVAGFEQAGSLDPVTVKFARLFANLKDRNVRQYLSIRQNKLPSDYIEKRIGFMNQLFGGELRYERDLEYVQATDGRKIPFSSLSSGQQELLPMWSLIDYFNDIDARRATPLNAKIWAQELLYIEEPEAHLFPSAQSLLMDFLISSASHTRGTGKQRSLILTTHSPYIMSKLNVFLKAGQLSRRKKRNHEINEIVPRECWLNDNQLSAYSIQDGILVNLLDSDGFIDGSYLDGISDEISNSYSRLLQIESEISSL
ncbi:MAG: ATP-binding protein [Asticcacaulis sp.]